DPLSHHLPLDAAALLGAGAVPGGGLPQVRPADAARDARQRIHAAADPALHAGAVRGLSAALCVWDEFLAVPDSRRDSERWVYSSCRAPVAALLRRAGAQDFPFLADPLERLVRGAADRSLSALSDDMNRRLALTTLCAPAVVLALGCSPAKPQFSGIDLSGADYAKDFHLPDQNGQMRSLKDFRGKIVAVFFGYTQCPDVCPTTLTEMMEAKRLLGDDGDKLQVIFITV